MVRVVLVDRVGVVPPHPGAAQLTGVLGVLGPVLAPVGPIAGALLLRPRLSHRVSDVATGRRVALLEYPGGTDVVRAFGHL